MYILFLIIGILLMISFIVAFIIFKRLYGNNKYYIFNIKPLRYNGAKTFIQKMSFFVSNCKSIPKVKGSHNLILDITNIGKKTYFRLIVPNEYRNDYYKIFTSNYKDFEVKKGGVYSEEEFISKYKGGIVFRTDSDTPFLKEEIHEEKVGENIKSIVNGVTNGSFQVMLNFDAKGETFADSSEIEDVKIENTLASSNINFVKDIGVSFRFLSFSDEYIETTMPGLIGGILNLGGKLGNITKQYSYGKYRSNPLSFKKKVIDILYKLIVGKEFKLSTYSPSDEMIFNSKEISYVFNFVPSDNTEILQYQSMSPVDAIKYQDEKVEREGDNKFTSVAQFDYPGIKDKYFKLHEKTLRRHTYVIGKTGTGKSTLLKRLIQDDLNKGKGFALIEPNGDLAEEVLDLIPKEREDDVIFVDPSVYLGRVCLSVFSFLRELRHYQQEYEIDQHNRSEDIGSDNRLYHMETEDKFMSMVVNMIKAVSVGGADHWGSRMDKIMKEVGTASLKYDLSEISDISTYLNKDEYRKAFIKAVDNIDLKESMAIFDNKTDKDREEAFQPVRNRFDVFLSDTMKNIFSGKPKFSLRDAMDSGKIIIFRLPKGTIGDGNASLLGSMMVALFWAMAQTRISIDEDKREDFTLYIDEFQNFVTDSFSQMLEEARKYRIKLVLANQFTKQIKHKNEAVFDSIKGNIGTFIALGLGSDDSNILSKYFGIDASNMTNIPPYHGYVKCEEYSPLPFNIKIDNVFRDDDKEYSGATYIKNLSYKKYGLDSEEKMVNDEFVIAKKRVYRALMSMEYYDKSRLLNNLRIKNLVFNKLIEQLHFEGIISINEEGITVINHDQININDDGYFDFEYEDSVLTEKSYISLGTYFRRFNRLPKFTDNIDSYFKQTSSNKLGKNINIDIEEEEIPNDVLDDHIENLSDGILTINKELFEIQEDNEYTQYSYLIKKEDYKKTFSKLSKELGFNDFDLFKSYLQNSDMVIEPNKTILKGYIGKKIHIII